jgi:hypothetical protein
MQSGSTYSVTLNNLIDSSVYTLYYAIANEYPLRPVFYGNVQSQFIFTTSEAFMLMSAVLLFILMSLIV